MARDTPIRLRATLTTGSGRTASDEVLVLVERHAQASPSDSAACWRNDHVSRVHVFNGSSPFCGRAGELRLRPGAHRRHAVPAGDAAVHGPDDRRRAAERRAGDGPRRRLARLDGAQLRDVPAHARHGGRLPPHADEHDRGGHRRAGAAFVLLRRHRRHLPRRRQLLAHALGERDTVNEAPDCRSSFGTTLQYTTLWRYVRGNATLFPFYDPRQRVTRGAGALLDEAGWLLFHEPGARARFRRLQAMRR
ncbi:MAG: hypothetical protein U1F67_09395 [Rubrivivax sp.]